ncbi:MAG: glycoside hydrolase family 140 protein [Bacteroides sp.]|nr:glycoside hydrolase family 140 protein [Bacteroides sp.]
MRRIPIIFFLVLWAHTVGEAQALKTSADNRFLETLSGSPFFWTGDTGWELFHRLDREEAARYLTDRAEKGFNVIQAVALYELQAFESPNAYGDYPLVGRDIMKPDTTVGNDPSKTGEYDYWDHVEYIITEAASHGMISGFLPCWGEYVTPRKREQVIGTVEQAYAYGWFVGNRFRALNDHMVWILGGDRLPDERENGVEIWRAMAEGISDAVNNTYGYNGQSDYNSTFMSYHCYTSSARWFHEDPWIDMHTWGSYHEKRDNERAYYEAQDDWKLSDPKPTLNSEPAYELLPVNYDWAEVSQGRFDDFDVRQQAYWSVFAGCCGHTYGCNPVWQMYKAENPDPPLTLQNTIEWEEALDEPGAFHMGYLKHLMLSRDFATRKPDQSILAENPHDPTGHLQACSGYGYSLVYIPTGKVVKIHLDRIPASELSCSWFNPRKGTFQEIDPLKGGAIAEFDPPGEEERGNDWVLVIDY